jgi:twitching motility protein PilJ
MAISIEDYEQTYQQAYKAYVQRNYEEAATLINQAVLSLPNDPNTHLLRGHIYYVLQQYDTAKEEYQKVLELAENPEIIDFANNGLENIRQSQPEVTIVNGVDERKQKKLLDLTETLAIEKEIELGDNFSPEKLHGDLDSKSLEEIEKFNSTSPFEISPDITEVAAKSNSTEDPEDPFSLKELSALGTLSVNDDEQTEATLDLPAFWQEEISKVNLEDSESNRNLQSNSENFVTDFTHPQNESNGSPFTQSTRDSENQLVENQGDFPFDFEDENLPIITNHSTTHSTNQDNFLYPSDALLQEDIDSQQIPQTFIEVQSSAFSLENGKESSTASTSWEVSSSMLDSHCVLDSRTDQSHFNSNDTLDLEAFESTFALKDMAVDENTSSLLREDSTQSNNIDFLEDFDEFDDLGTIPRFDITEDSTFGKSQLHSGLEDTTSGQVLKIVANTDTSSPLGSDRDAELFTMTGSQDAVPVFSQTEISKIEPQVSVEQGLLAPLENAPLAKKQWLIAGTVGVVSAIVVATVSFVATNFSPPQQRESVRNTGWAMTLAAGLASFATTGFVGNLALRQIRRTTKDMQAQFEAVRQGNLNVQATVYSEDELGQLATGFNEMARVIFTTTNEATRKAQEQEEAKENLQRQVIRLLDDVEGAARGDLTVQAEVTADVLGAVADAFNLTIQNLRDIVQQVKVAAKEVTKGATNSETFARALSSDALRQAEELAVTLSSVQVMTDSIQRVAEAAREAEAVARDASEIALKGGDAVENTVAGILEIRETVAETTRKVKRLAESSQEISKIVALISQIASRTNLLALNASIEAARAGEAGRGFAIVADEVRQLADKSAKSLKEIEQIVMQIQSETGSVMTAMEEGTQQVIQGTKLAEEAKRSLDNIIQVAKRIDTLVRSITSDTVEQTETSRAVAQVMQSVELTAQETSQEAQRVSGALQHLVGVSRDLIASVERFRVETAEN